MITVTSEPASFASEMLGYFIFFFIPLLIAAWWTNRRK